MANPLPNEKELFDKIIKEKITVNKVVWELLNHHLGNDLYAISMAVGSHITGDDKEPIPIGEAEKILEHVYALNDFVDKLREATKEKKPEENKTEEKK